MGVAPLLGAIFTGIGTGVQIIGAIKQSNAAAEAQEEAARRANENAVLEREKAAEDEKQFRIFSRKAIADQKTGYAASGVSIDASAGDVLAESLAASESDALKIRKGGEIRARGYESDATFLNKAAGATRAGGYLSGVGIGLAGAAKTTGYIDDYVGGPQTRLKRV